MSHYEFSLRQEVLITHRCTLADIEEGYRIFENRLDGVLKVAVAP